MVHIIFVEPTHWVHKTPLFGMGFNLIIKVIIKNSNIHGELMVRETNVISCD